MPSDFTVNINCPKKKLIIFARALYGSEPLVIPRRDNLNRLINLLLREAPEKYRPEHYGEYNLAIRLPYYEDKNIHKFYYLNEKSQHIIVNRFDDLFKLTFRRHMDKVMLLGVMQQQDAVYTFMQEYDLPEDINSDLLKDYQRYRKLIAVRRHRKRLKDSELA